MEIGTQIRKYRNALGLSQEELAAKIYVTRQTISNWENERSYPDIHSLLLLSSVFQVSLDQLIKGDVDKMKQEINKEAVDRLNALGKVFTILFAACIAAFVPLVVFLKIPGGCLGDSVCGNHGGGVSGGEAEEEQRHLHVSGDCRLQRGQDAGRDSEAAGDWETALPDRAEDHRWGLHRRGDRRHCHSADAALERSGRWAQVGGT